MPYQEFAYWYDALNSEADYTGLTQYIAAAFRRHGLNEGIVADLGCGTGEVTLALSAAGYDMIAIDNSYDMLAIFREKLEEENIEGSNILLLQQDIAELDLYGTIQGAVSTFDTFNHLPKPLLCKTLERISLFMEKGGVFVFDANTPYKHEHILGENQYYIEGEDNCHCVWQNHYSRNKKAVCISLAVFEDEKKQLEESFWEYTYPLDFWKKALPQYNFKLIDVLDGETFKELTKTSQRYLFTAVKI